MNLKNNILIFLLFNAVNYLFADVKIWITNKTNSYIECRSISATHGNNLYIRSWIFGFDVELPWIYLYPNNTFCFTFDPKYNFCSYIYLAIMNNKFKAIEEIGPIFFYGEGDYSFIIDSKYEEINKKNSENREEWKALGIDFHY